MKTKEKCNRCGKLAFLDDTEMWWSKGLCYECVGKEIGKND